MTQAVVARPVTAATWARAFAGMLAGGLVGWFLFHWLAKQGYIALAVPGALVGIGGGLAMRGKSMAIGAVAAVAALALGLACRHSIDAYDRWFGEFLEKVPDLSPFMLISLAAGTLIAFWFGRGR